MKRCASGPCFFRPGYFPPTSLRIPLLLIGVPTAICTTILGALAIVKIKHSHGRLYGLRFATAETLLFPLLALFQTVGGIAACFFNQKTRTDVGIMVSIALVVCFFAGCAAWRAIVGKPAVPKIPARADETKPEKPAA